MDELLEYIGLEGGTPDELKAKFDETFIKREKALTDEDIKKAHFRTSYAAFDNVLARTFGDIVPAEELSKAEKTAEKVSLLRSKVDELVRSYEEKVNKTSKPTDREAKLAQDIEELKSQINLKQQGIESLTNEFNTTKTTYENEIKNIRTTQAFSSEVVGRLTFSDTKDEIWKRGFLTSMAESYKVEHNGERLVIRTKDDQPIPNPARHGEELTPYEVYSLELEKAGGTKVTEGKVYKNGETTTNVQSYPVRTFHPNYTA